MKAKAEQSEQRGGIVAYRASAELIAEIEAATAAEGITRSDVALDCAQPLPAYCAAARERFGQFARTA